MSDIVNRANSLIQTQINALNNIKLTPSFSEAINLMLETKGKVVTIGIGKAGYIARKAASTFCTTGTPSVFLHPGDASHGDVGLLHKDDLILAYSNSGKNREVLETISFGKKLGANTVISITRSKDSPLAELSNTVIELGEIKEACPLGFTPTSSTTVMLAISDALAVLLMELKGMDNDSFSLRHHGGYLGEESRKKANS